MTMHEQDLLEAEATVRELEEMEEGVVSQSNRERVQEEETVSEEAM